MRIGLQEDARERRLKNRVTKALAWMDVNHLAAARRWACRQRPLESECVMQPVLGRYTWRAFP